MIKVLFICHGNICRSTMAQFLFAEMARRQGLSVEMSEEKAESEGKSRGKQQRPADLYVDSAATSREEIGNPVDRRTAAKLKEHGIPCGVHHARQITKKDYEFFDLIILMDQENLWGIRRILREDPERKIHLMLEYVSEPSFRNRDGSVRDVDDPWYTHDFESTYRDLFAGCEGLLQYLTENPDER